MSNDFGTGAGVQCGCGWMGTFWVRTSLDKFAIKLLYFFYNSKAKFCLSV